MTPDEKATLRAQFEQLGVDIVKYRLSAGAFLNSEVDRHAADWLGEKDQELSRFTVASQAEMAATASRAAAAAERAAVAAEAQARTAKHALITAIAATAIAAIALIVSIIGFLHLFGR